MARSRRDETAAKIAAKMAKLAGSEGSVVPNVEEAGVESEDRSALGGHGGSGSPSEDPSGTHPALTSSAQSGDVGDQPTDRADEADVRDGQNSPATPGDEDPEVDPEIARLEAQGINALVEVDSLPEPEFPDPLPESEQGELITIHFLEDGMSFDGRIWYRGEEISCRRGDETFQKTVDRNGKSWLDMTEGDQAYMYEKIMFRHGPWPYQSMEERLAELGLGGATNDRDRKRQQREAKPPLPMSR